MRPVWFVRHGESTANASRTIAGHLDADLTPRGAAQARALRSWMAEAAPERVCASDLRRAYRTAQLAWPHEHDPHIERYPELRERHVGDWEGAGDDVIGAAGMSVLLTWDGVPPRGESQAMLAHRVISWLAEHDDGRPTAFFVHGGLIRCVVGLLDDTPTHAIGRWRVKNTEVVRREVPPDRWTQLLNGSALSGLA